jgi:hypothetical protein
MTGQERLYDLLADPGAQADMLGRDPRGIARFHADSLAQAFTDWHRACVLASAGTPERGTLESP